MSFHKKETEKIELVTRPGAHPELMCECAFQALSTIVWDNGFAEWGRTAFMVNETLRQVKEDERVMMAC